jgi:hypothetical protein
MQNFGIEISLNVVSWKTEGDRMTVLRYILGKLVLRMGDGWN